MAVQHILIVHAVNVVAGEDQNVARIVEIYEVQVLINSVRRALIPLGAGLGRVRREDEYSAIAARHIPRVAVSKVSVQAKRSVLGENAYGVNVGIRAVGQ